MLVQMKYTRLIPTSGPTEIPTDAVKVTFRDVAINHVPHKALENLTQCRELEFIDTNISVIDSHAWHGLDNLAELTLSQNHLENLEQGHFKHLRKPAETSSKSK